MVWRKEQKQKQCSSSILKLWMFGDMFLSGKELNLEKNLDTNYKC